MPQLPAGGGIMAPPIAPCPSLRMSIKARRSRDSTIARRSSGLSNGGLAESKLCDVLLAFAIARRWKDVKSNALEPGWVATKMGGPSAPNDLHQGCVM